MMYSKEHRVIMSLCKQKISWRGNFAGDEFKAGVNGIILSMGVLAGTGSTFLTCFNKKGETCTIIQPPLPLAQSSLGKFIWRISGGRYFSPEKEEAEERLQRELHEGFVTLLREAQEQCEEYQELEYWERVRSEIFLQLIGWNAKKV